MLRTGVLVVACAAVLRRLQKLSIAAAKRRANEGRHISSPDETGAHAFVVKSTKNVQLYCRRWGSPASPPPTAAFLLFHSELLNSSVFKPFAEKMAEKGFVVYAMDLTGFGKSGCQQGVPSHIESYLDYLDDIDALVDVAKRETSDAPIVMYGEGLGATCALAYALQESNKDKVATLVTASATLQPYIPAEKVEHGIYGILSKFLPASPGPRENPPYDIAELFADEEIGITARDNFENLQPASIRKIREMAKLCDYVHAHVSELSVPLLVLHGKDDVRHDMTLSEELKMKAGSSKKYLRPYPSTKHGLLYSNPITVDRVIVDIVAFVDNNIPSPRPNS